MAKKMRSSESGSSVTLSPETVSFVYAFLQTHVPKLASKLASKFPNLDLEAQASQAEVRSNALESTIQSAMQVEGSEIFEALGRDEKRVKERKLPKSKKETKEKNKDKEELEELKSDATELAQAVVETAESSIPDPKSMQAEEVSVEVTTSPESKAPKKSKKSTQGERFQRVKSNEVQYLDDRLRDMSYEAKSGSGDWGARANADLIVTRGKAFTKEKNKKKRGSYRGGAIDQGSHSIKFTYDDE